MAEEVILPRVDMDMAEGKIAHWYVKNGDAVKKGQLLFEIETDKATMEIDAHADGTIDGISSEVGVSMPVGQVVAWILAPGEKLPDGSAPPEVTSPVTGDAEMRAVDSPPAEITPVSATASNDAATTSLLRATPLARSLAREQRIDLHGLQGSGPNGRIVAADLKTAAAPVPATSAMATVDALHLNWLTRGNGVPVVFLHGFSADQGSWRPLSTLLAGESCVGIDLPNHGKSPTLAVQSIHDIAAQVRARLTEESISEFHLVGHSLGGAVAIAVAQALQSASPRSLRSLTLLAPAGFGPEINGAFIQGVTRATQEQSLRPWLLELFHDKKWLSASFLATAFAQLRSAQQRSRLATLADVLMPDGTQAESLREALALVTVPIKVIWGVQDRIVPFAHSRELPPRAGLHRLPGVGHLPQVEAAELVADLIRQQIQTGRS